MGSCQFCNFRFDWCVVRLIDTPTLSFHNSRLLKISTFRLLVFTTIGYGNVCPTTAASKIFLVPYSLVGFWFFGVTEARAGAWFSKKMKMGKKIPEQKRGCCNAIKILMWLLRKSCLDELFGVILSIAVLVVFLSTMAALFTATEPWTYMVRSETVMKTVLTVYCCSTDWFLVQFCFALHDWLRRFYSIFLWIEFRHSTCVDTCGNDSGRSNIALHGP